MRAFRSLTMLVLIVAGIALGQELPLLQRLKETDLSEFITKEATVFRDASTNALTFTFRYAGGEPEVRIPVRKLGLPTDWREYRSIQFTFETTSLEAVAIGFSDGKVTKDFVMEPLPGIRIDGVIPFDAFVQTRTMTPLVPLGYKVWPSRLFTFEKVEEVSFRMRFPAAPSQFTLHTFTLRRDVPEDGIATRKPLIDRFGQWIPENWPAKAHSPEHLRALWNADKEPQVKLPYSEMGGDRSRKLRSTGFFRVERDRGKWVFVDPDGHPFFSAGMDLVGYKPDSFATSVRGREYLFEELPPKGPAWLKPDETVSFYVANIMGRHGENWPGKWQAHIVSRLKSWGFNTIANWSDYDVATTARMPYVLPLSGWQTKKTFPFPWDFPDVFSDEFERNVDAAARRQVEKLKDDRYLIGWFIGNEPHWARPFGSLIPFPHMVLNDPESSATKAHLEGLLKANPAEAQRIKDEFLYTCAQRYFEVINAAIRKHDPNHLVLGIRYAGRPEDRWVELSRIFDVFSINIYSKEFKPDEKDIRHFSEVSGKPVLIGEFTAAAPGRGMQGLFYWGHKVKDQAERAKAYRYYVEAAAASPYIIGTHWFQMVDDLPTGRPSDEERLNYGFLNVIDLPYKELVEAARQTHRRLYELKYGKAVPFGEKPNYH
ncbi:MAG: hypothetical protein U5J83_06090 [Bryobacterales bacterium]|nr:hypothetical protein [Bryobacterales bacterium]